MISTRAGFVLAITAAAAAVIATGVRLREARSAHRAESARLAAIAEDVRTLQHLRTAEAHAQNGEPPEDDLLGSVRDAIRDAGLPASSFQGLSTPGDEAVRGREGYRRKPYRLELSGLDATDLGSFLSIWQAEQPLWAVERIELRRQHQSGRRARNTAPSGYALSLTMATVYADTTADGETAP